MPAISSFFWTLGFILSVLVAPQLRVWTWGMTMLCLGLSCLFALPSIWNGRKGNADLLVAITGAVLVIWIVVRACFSPVLELAQSDILLTAMAVSTFVSFRAIGKSPNAMRIFVSGFSIIAAASIYVVYRQLSDISFTPVFPVNKSPYPSGFYGHYSYAASFFIVSFSILSGFAFFSKKNIPVRILWGVLALLSFAAVYYTRSRGAYLGVAASFVCFFPYFLLMGKRDEKKWFAPAVILLPLLLIVAIWLVSSIGMDVFKERAAQGNISVEKSFDNSTRLNLLNIAVSCIELHPWIGGGARSFSWECFRFWDIESGGLGSNKPEHVHNEFVQTITDYGIVGAGILLLFILTVVAVGISRAISKTEKSSNWSGDGLRAGGFAGFVGLLVHSNFEGIFRIPPGAILLALCLSAICASTLAKGAHNVKSLRQGKASDPRNKSSRRADPVAAQSEGIASRPLLEFATVSILVLSSSLAMGYFGLKATRITPILWTAFFSKQPQDTQVKLDAVNRAVAIWPTFSHVQTRAFLYQEIALSEDEEDPMSPLKASLRDFELARKLHPYDPTSAIGSGVIFSRLGKYAKAEEALLDAIHLEGGMEAGFQARYLYAKHLLSKGLAEIREGKSREALDSLAIADRTIEEAIVANGYNGSHQQHLLRPVVYYGHGLALEEVAEYGEAMAKYDQASQTWYGDSAHYHAAALYGKLAVKAWEARRQSDALFLFNQARQRINLVASLPDGVTTKMRDEWIAYLDQSIGKLKAAKYMPSEKVDLNQGFN